MTHLVVTTQSMCGVPDIGELSGAVQYLARRRYRAQGPHDNAPLVL